MMVLGSEVNGIAEVEEVWTILNHQLKHCAYTKPPMFECNHCGHKASNREAMNIHVKDRAKCKNGNFIRESRVQELLQKCEKVEENRR